MSLGNRIYLARKEKGLTQSALAEKLNVTFQTVSLWENDKCEPDLNHLKQLSSILDVTMNYLAEIVEHPFSSTQHLFDEEHMYTFIKSKAQSLCLENTLKALPFAKTAHEGQVRKGAGDVPYIYHPLTMACHAFALGFKDDAIIASCLLHDVMEDCGILKEELPVDEEIKTIVYLLSNLEDGEDARKNYYKNIRQSKKAVLVKCLDRIHNLSGLPFGLNSEKQVRMILETEQYIMPYVQILKEDIAYNDAAWLIHYQMKSLLEVLKKTID